MITKLAGEKHWVSFVKYEDGPEEEKVEGYSTILLDATWSDMGDREYAESEIMVTSLRYYRDTLGILLDTENKLFTLDRKPVLDKENLTFRCDDGSISYIKPIEECSDEELKAIISSSSFLIKPFSVKVAREMLEINIENMSLFGNDFEDGFKFCQEVYKSKNLIEIDKAFELFIEHITTSMEVKGENSLNGLKNKLISNKA